MTTKRGQNKTTVTTDMEGMFNGIKEEENEDEDEEEDDAFGQRQKGGGNYVTPSGKNDKKRGRGLNEAGTKEEGNNKGEAVPEEVPSTIKVRRTASFDGPGVSSIGRLSSTLDMSLMEVDPELQVDLVKKCVRQRMFSIWKFYDKEYHAHFNQDENTMCGFLLKHTKLRGNEDWWVQMRKLFLKTHTDMRNNAIKSMQAKFRGKHMSCIVHRP